jgi:hypothetical protein
MLQIRPRARATNICQPRDYLQGGGHKMWVTPFAIPLR